MTGPIGKAPSLFCMPCSISRCWVSTSCGRGCLHHRVGGVLRARTEQAGVTGRELGGNLLGPNQARRRAFRNRPGEEPFGGGHRQQRGGDVRTRTFAEDGDIVGVTAELRDVVADPLQRHHQIAQEQVAVDGDVRCRQR